MGAIAKAANEVQATGGRRTFKDLVRDQSAALQSVMPKGFRAERLVQMAVTAYKTTPKLSECTTASILSCCLQCASLGLEPSAVDGLGRAYILPYFNKKTNAYEAQFILGKNGMVELVQRSGAVSTLHTQCVYEGDQFDYREDETGIHIEYVPDWSAERDAAHMRLVYLTAQLKDGGFVCLVMGRKEVDAVRARSKAGNYGPWKTDYEAMAEKTVLRRAFNRGMLPRSVEVARGVAQDEATPVVIDEDGYQVFGEMGAAVEVPANVDPATGEVQEAADAAE